MQTVLAALVMAAGIGEAPNPPARVGLIAAGDVDRPGDTWIALEFQVEPGWHIYWRNPGESGSAPKVTWSLPAGVRVGEWQWPAPQRLVSAGLVNYGYERRMVLPARLTLPSTAPAGAPRIDATVNYAVCREVCISVKQQASLVLSATSIADRSSARLITAARRSAPRPLPAAARLSVRCAAGDFVVELSADRAFDGVTLLPLDPGTIEDSAPQQVRRLADRLELRARRSTFASAFPKRLQGVLVTAGDGAYSIDAPVLCQSS